ncbi:MAG: ribosomal-protein-alanine acetyltransferase [Thermoleophilia bacterium]|nr:ribosomal-protein-alanine acetyltransferase [Thermoleophilia bacterium]
MPLLCLDTSSRVVIAALIERDGTVVRSATADARAQGLLELLECDVCPAGQLHTVDAIVVGVGPGGFTGLRVGVATARGLAETLGIPLYGVSSLLAVAAAAARQQPGMTIWGAIDAKRGEYFVQPFCGDADGAVHALEPARAIAATELAALDGVVVTDADATPDSLAIAASLAVTAASDPDALAAPGDPLAVVPEYVRGPDALPPRLELRIDALTPADLGQLDVLERRCFPNPWSPAMYAEELRRAPSDGVHLAARNAATDGRLVGAALAARIGDCWHVMNVLVDPSMRRRGIAGRLLETLLDHTHALGAGDGLTLEVRAGNDGAVALYERHGFVNHGRRRGYYTDTGEDAFVMWRDAGTVAPDDLDLDLAAASNHVVAAPAAPPALEDVTS